MRKRVTVAAVLVVGLLLVVGLGAKVREVQVWGFLPPGGRENVRAGRGVLDELRDLNPDLVIEEHGWSGHAGIPLATFRYPEGYVIEDDLGVPEGMERDGILEEHGPYERYSNHLQEVVVYDRSLWWHRYAPWDGQEWSCSISLDVVGERRLVEMAVSCFLA